MNHANVPEFLTEFDQSYSYFFHVLKLIVYLLSVTRTSKTEHALNSTGYLCVYVMHL